MIFENIEVSSSLSITGSFVIPIGPSGSRPSGSKLQTGSLFWNTDSNSAESYNGAVWQTVSVNTSSIPPDSVDIEYLVVAGGGGGGGSDTSGEGAGGGGAGGYLSSSLASVESGSSFTITVGSGGSAGNNSPRTAGGDGGDSSIAGASISTITATGGGGGGFNSGRDGGSGGGTPYASGVGNDPGSGTVGQGHDGGYGSSSNRSGTSGGGGGAGEAGGTDGVGHGGDGLASSITGTSITRAGGGAGGNSGTAGDGGGGTSPSGNGTANTGGGAGGGSSNTSGGSGGSGVVILAYDSGSMSAQGGTELKPTPNGRRVHKFLSSGTWKVGSTTDYPDRSPAAYLPSGISIPSVQLHPDQIGQNGDWTLIPNLGTLNHDFYRLEVGSGTIDKADTDSIGFFDAAYNSSGGNAGIIQSTSPTRTLSSDFSTKQDLTVNLFFQIDQAPFNDANYTYIWNFVSDTDNDANSYNSEFAAFHWRGGLTDTRKFSTAFRNSSGTTLNNDPTNPTADSTATWIMNTVVLDYGSTGTVSHYTNGTLTNSPTSQDLTTGGATSNFLNFGGSYATQYITGGVHYGMIQVWMGTALSSANVSTLWNYYKSDYGLS